MNNVLKWIGIVLGVLVALIAIFALVVVFSVNGRANTVYDVSVASLEIPTDAESLAWGEHLYITRGCVDCHGENLAGGIFIDDPALGTLYAANLTSGEGGLGQRYGAEDYLRAFRHGLSQDGTPVYFMEAQLYWYISDADAAALIGYIQSADPVDNETGENKLGPLGYVLTFANQIAMFPAEVVDHDAARPEAPEYGPTAAYGEYIAISCTGCHNPAYSGGPITGAPPDFPPALNLTPGGELQGWTYEMFATAMTTGVLPSGRQMDTAYMPWETFQHFEETELQAIWAFLQTLPPKEMGER